MLYRTLADLVLAFHAVFITFVMFGGLLALWRPRLAWLHLPALAWGALVIGGLALSADAAENALRARAGQQGYAGFIEHYRPPPSTRKG